LCGTTGLYNQYDDIFWTHICDTPLSTCEVRIQQRVDAAEQIAAVLTALKRLPQV
jgi:isoleucyl-tRNA synthetase